MAVELTPSLISSAGRPSRTACHRSRPMRLSRRTVTSRFAAPRRARPRTPLAHPTRKQCRARIAARRSSALQTDTQRSRARPAPLEPVSADSVTQRAPRPTSISAMNRPAATSTETSPVASGRSRVRATCGSILRSAISLMMQPAERMTTVPMTKISSTSPLGRPSPAIPQRPQRRPQQQPDTDRSIEAQQPDVGATTRGLDVDVLAEPANALDELPLGIPDGLRVESNSRETKSLEHQITGEHVAHMPGNSPRRPCQGAQSFMRASNLSVPQLTTVPASDERCRPLRLSCVESIGDLDDLRQQVRVAY